MTLNKGTLGPMLLVSNFNHLQTALAVFYGFQGEAGSGQIRRSMAPACMSSIGSPCWIRTRHLQ